MCVLSLRFVFMLSTFFSAGVPATRLGSHLCDPMVAEACAHHSARHRQCSRTPRCLRSLWGKLHSRGRALSWWPSCRFTTVVLGTPQRLPLAIESCGYTRSAAGIYHWSAHPHVGYSSRKCYWVGCLLQSFFDCPVRFGQSLMISTKTMTFDSRDDCNDLIQYMITFDMTCGTASSPCPLCRHTWTGYPNPSKRTSAFDVHGIFKVIDVHYLYTYPTGTQVSIHTLSSYGSCATGGDFLQCGVRFRSIACMTRYYMTPYC